MNESGLSGYNEASPCYQAVITTCLLVSVLPMAIEEVDMNDTTEFPRLETDRLILRMLTHDDIDIAFPHFSNPEVTRYQDEHPVTSVDGVKEIIDWGKGLFEHNMGILWGIFYKDGPFLGEVNYVARPDNNFTQNIHRAELG